MSTQEEPSGFLDRPSPLVADTTLAEIGLPSFADEMLCASMKGPIQLATFLWSLDNKERWESPFKRHSYEFQRVVVTLSSISPLLRQHLITGTLHHLQRDKTPPGINLMRDNRPVLTSSERAEGTPHVYALAISTSGGVAPSPQHLLDGLNMMEQYIATMFNNTAEASVADKLAAEIDEGSPAERDWSGGTRGEARKLWTIQKGSKDKKIDNPRRYCLNGSQRTQIRTFIAALRKRIGSVQKKNHNNPTPWSITYVGYTDREDRIKEHQRHLGSSSPIKYLFEAILALKIKSRSTFLIQEVEIVPVCDPADVGIAEHTVSLLAHSYSQWGGLNGALAGQGGVVTKAMENDDQAWVNSVRMVLMQGVYKFQIQAMEQALEGMKLLQAFPSPESELDSYVKAKKTLTEMEEDVRKINEEAVSTIRNVAEQRMQRLERRLELEKLEEDHGILDNLDLDFDEME